MSGIFYGLAIRENIREAIKENRNQIEIFATKCIYVIGEKTIPLVHDREILKKYLSAAYFANSRYFERNVNLEKEHIIFHIPNSIGHATHKENNLYGHEIEIPISWFKSYSNLFHAMDAETRHAIHQNILNDKGLREDNLAERAFHVIAETIDEGKCIYPTTAYILDPFINDFYMFSEKHGHDGAKYLLAHLSVYYPETKKQLNWLARLPVRSRQKLDKEYETMLEEVSKIQTNRIHIIDEDGNDYRIVCNSNDIDLFRTRDFYMGIRSSDNFTRKLEDIRLYAIDNYPYVPNDSIEMYGKIIDKFASQLDYVVLKLHTFC